MIGAGLGGITGAWRAIASLVGHWHLRGYGQWAVVERATGKVIGRVGPWYPEGWPGIELGWIIQRSRWGNGFATEAAQAALTWFWKSVDADHVISMIQPDNTRSIRVAEKIGERLERTEVQNSSVVHIYGIDRPRRD
jgi:RimJ/RimL family protein N-acetyltransferase